MKLEKEITLLVETDYETLDNILKLKGFEIRDIYYLNDIYMINNNEDLNKLNTLEILKKCILVRNVLGIEKSLLYKYKKFKNNGDIIEQSKVSCPILDVDKAVEFMNSINYKQIFTINDKCTVYSNNEIEFVVQNVNGKYLFIEMEDKFEYINKEYNTIEEMIREFDKYDLPVKKGNYFVKKAEIILNETLNVINN